MIHVQKGLLPKSIWLACSAGVDSIVAAHLLSIKMGYDVTLWHFNHKLRPQNNEMQKSVIKFAGKFKIEYISCSRKYKTDESEADLRKHRIEAMTKCIPEGSTVVSCHHLDDCVESYLMNCFNGTSEYFPVPIQTDFGTIKIVRPFLTNTKERLEEYAQQNDLWDFIVEDVSNKNLRYRRNWIRHECRPLIEKKYPGLQKVVRKKVITKYKKVCNDQGT